MTLVADDLTGAEWAFIGLFVLAACLLLVPHGNAASVEGAARSTVDVSRRRGRGGHDERAGDVYPQRGDSSLSTGWIVTMTVIWICSRSTTYEDRRFTGFPYYVYDKDFDGKPDTAFVDEMGNGICGEMRLINPKDIVMEPPHNQR